MPTPEPFDEDLLGTGATAVVRVAHSALAEVLLQHAPSDVREWLTGPIGARVFEVQPHGDRIDVILALDGLPVGERPQILGWDLLPSSGEPLASEEDVVGGA